MLLKKELAVVVVSKEHNFNPILTYHGNTIFVGLSFFVVDDDDDDDDDDDSTTNATDDGTDNKISPSFLLLIFLTYHPYPEDDSLSLASVCN